MRACACVVRVFLFYLRRCFKDLVLKSNNVLSASNAGIKITYVISEVTQDTTFGVKTTSLYRRYRKYSSDLITEELASIADYSC